MILRLGGLGKPYFLRRHAEMSAIPANTVIRPLKKNDTNMKKIP